MSGFNKVHFIAIAGIGMSALAKMLLSQGTDVSGSDLVLNELTDELASLGATVYEGHQASHIKSPDLVVVSSAVSHDNVEYLTAQSQGVAIVTRGQLLAKLFNQKKGIAISGSHGKTSTSALLADIFIAAQLNADIVIGGKLNSINSNAMPGSGEYFLAEADESDQSFLYMRPEIAVVTSISPDHLVNYQNDFAVLQQAFLDFLQHLPKHSLAVLCADDDVVLKLAAQVQAPQLTYGFSEVADIRAVDLRQDAFLSVFTIQRPKQADLLVQLNLPGRHNILNALAAIAVATQLGIADDVIVSALSGFKGVARRVSYLGSRQVAEYDVLLLEDYGHHPNEVAAMINTVREAWPDRQLVMAFQPHRYTRTKDLFDEFVQVLKHVDQLFLLPIYAASEAVIPGVDSEALLLALTKINVEVSLIQDKASLLAGLNQCLRKDAVLLIQGAGDINKRLGF